MKAITTQFLPATVSRPRRIKASDSDGNTCTVPIPETMDTITEIHAHACRNLCRQQDWHGDLIGGELKPSVWVWVFTDHAPAIQLDAWMKP